MKKPTPLKRIAVYDSRAVDSLTDMVKIHKTETVLFAYYQDI
jgi:hypothetical protein